MKRIPFTLSLGLIFFSLSASLPFQEGNLETVIELSPSGYEIANSVSFSPDGNLLAVGTTSGIHIFDSRTYSETQFISTGTWVRSLAFSPNGIWLAAGLFDHSASIWKVGTWEAGRTFDSHAQWVRSVAFSPDSTTLITCSDDNTVRLWDIRDGTLKLDLESLEGVRVVSLSRDGQILAAGLKNGAIELRRVSDGNTIKTLTGHTDWVRSLAFSPDGMTLASGAFDATVRLWNFSSGQLITTLTDHQSSVLSLAFSPDGRFLASGSVDMTVKLWNASNGDLLRTWIGHENFVYGVAFSPDGQTLASGAADNTVRLWEVNAAITGENQQPATPGDCRTCHHPIGQATPPRVIQVRCDACHANGAGLNFCPIFPRDPLAVSPPLAMASGNMDAGVPVTAKNLAVVISYPTNGENLYTTGQYRSFLPVTGQVFYAGSMEDVKVELTAFADGMDLPVLTLTTQPARDGRFTFRLTLNPTQARPISIKLGGLGCTECHEESRMQGGLPNGAITLVISAIAPDGTALDERRFKIDASGTAQVEVHVIDEESGEPIPGVPVHASTVLYDWRARTASQTSDEEGSATLSLEALTEASTSYEITVPQTSIEGYFYEGTEPVSLSLPPGATSHEPVVVHVQKETIQLNGQVIGADASDAWSVWAIHLPDGAFRSQAATEAGEFSFQRLPVGEYILTASAESPASGNDWVQPIQVEVTGVDHSPILLQAIRFPVRRGRVSDKDGHPIPFVWITDTSSQHLWSDPVSGEFIIRGENPAADHLEAWAPGYYSQVLPMESTSTPNTPQSIVLEIQPETNLVRWGTGHLVVPPETYYEETANGLILEKGWLWGESGSADPLTLQVSGISIYLQQGNFLLEYLPGSGGWFHLADGEASILAPGGEETTVRGNQMVMLTQSGYGSPSAYDSVVLNSLRASRDPRIGPVWQPTLGARLRDSLARLGISMLQVITFVTYLMVIVVLAVLLVGGIYWLWKRYMNS